MKKNPIAIMGAVLAVLVLIELIFARNLHPHFWWDKIPGLYGLVGLGACVLVIVSKKLAKWGLQRPEVESDNE